MTTTINIHHFVISAFIDDDDNIVLKMEDDVDLDAKNPIYNTETEEWVRIGAENKDDDRLMWNHISGLLRRPKEGK